MFYRINKSHKSVLSAVFIILGTISAVSADVAVGWNFNYEAGTTAPETMQSYVGNITATRRTVNEGYDVFPAVSVDSKGTIAYDETLGFLPVSPAGSLHMRAANSAGKLNGYAYRVSKTDTETIFPSYEETGLLKPFTIEFIAKINTSGTTNGSIFSLLGRHTYTFSLEFTKAGNLQLRVDSDTLPNNPAVALSLDAFPKDDKWHHFAFVWDVESETSPSGTVSIVTDYGKYTKSKKCAITSYNMGTFWIGPQNKLSPSLDFDEFRISSSALSVEEFMHSLRLEDELILAPMNDLPRTATSTPTNFYPHAEADAENLTRDLTTPMLYGSGGGYFFTCAYAGKFTGETSATWTGENITALGSGPFTLETMFVSSSLEDQEIFSFTGRRLSTSAGALVYSIGETSTAIGTGAVCDGLWHHVAVTYTLPADETASGTIKIYLDGVLLATVEDTLPELDLEEKQVVAGNGFTGRMALLRLDRSVSDPSDFLITSKFAAASDPTLVYWNFDAPGQTGIIFSDSDGVFKDVYGRSDIRLDTSASYDNRGEGISYEEEDYLPLYTNDVPARYVWDETSMKVYNPENSGSVFFKHYSEEGAEKQVRLGSTLGYANRHNGFPSNITAECFMKIDKTFKANFSIAICCIQTGNKPALWQIDMEGNHSPRLRYDLVSLNKTIKSNTRIDDDEWHHVAATVDYSSGTSAVVRIYIDYVLKNENNLVGTELINFDSANTKIIFGHASTGYPFSGMIDEPRISEGSLTPERFLRPFTPRANLIGAWLLPVAQTLSGAEVLMPATNYLTGTFSAADVTFSSDLPIPTTVFKPASKSILTSGSALFSGEGGMTVPSAAIAGTKSFTFEATVNGTGSVVTKKRIGGTSWSFGTDEDGYAMFSYNMGEIGANVPTEIVKSDVNIDDGEWHHIALTVDRSGDAPVFSLYVDGTLAVSRTLEGWYMDGESWIVGENFAGNIVGVRFSPSVLAPTGFMYAEAPKSTIVIIR